MFRLYLPPMLAKKSWDVERKAPNAPVAAAPPERTQKQPKLQKPKQPRAIKAPKRNKERRITKPTLSNEPLKVRRARARTLFYIVVSGIGVLSIAGLFYAAWSPMLRIEEVHVEGLHADAIKTESQSELEGTYLFIIPRNSLFFLPVNSIRAHILREHPDVVAVSVHASGLTGITVVNSPRSTAFLWCGVTRDASGDCYEVDTDGLIFSKVDPAVDSTLSSKFMHVYAAIDGDSLNPLRTHVAYASALPSALRLAKALKTLQANITELVLHDDEADFYTSGGTRITYVIGREEATATLAASVFPTLHVNDGSVEYVDLRFEGKVYLRKQPVAGE